MIEIVDRSTETGLRAQIFSGTTNTVVNLTGEELRELVRQAKAGLLDEVATKPIIPFIY